MTSAAEEALKRAGKLAAPLVLPGCDWVHRRVQRVSYLEPQLMVNDLSVDFTVPSERVGAYVPVSVLPKWPPLYRFDFRAADGAPLPLLTSRQNGVVDQALMLALVEEVSRDSLGDPNFVEAVRRLCRGPETHLEESFDHFREGLKGDVTDSRVERLLDIGAMLTDATFLWLPVSPEQRGRQQICKVQYLIRSVEDHSWQTRVLRSLSWQHPAEYIPLWHIGADANFHAEVEAPHVLTIRSVEPRYYWFGEGGGDGEEEEATVEAEAAGLRPDEFVDREGRLAHVYVSGRRPLAADLLVTFAPSRSVLFSMFMAALMIAGLVSSMYYWRDEMSAASELDAAVAVLILVPALIGYVVMRPSDPPLVRRYVFGAQLLSLASGAIPLLMAVLLLRYANDPACLHDAWLWSMRASWFFAVLLMFSWLRSGQGRHGQAGTAD
jgi:hypothetical protein